MYMLTIYELAATVILLTWAFCRLVPRIPHSGGMRGPRFWLALVLVVALYRALNGVFFTLQSTLYDQPDAFAGLATAAVLAGLTSVLLQQQTNAARQFSGPVR